jgi:dTMP kinase
MSNPARRRRSKGLFITLEGPEGSGKSTQIRFLTSALRRAGYIVVQTREPGGTPLAEAIRRLLLLSLPREPIAPETEALLIFAARSQHVARLIRPKLDQGAIVLCDRFSDSTLAYQGFGRGLKRAWLEAANDAATGGVAPDLTLLLDLPVNVGLARRRTAMGRQNRLDRESERFHHVVRRGFLTLARQSPRRIRVVDADRSARDIRAELLAFVLGWTRKRRHPRNR